MITYEEMLARLRENEDENYRAFHKKLLKNDAINVIGVRMPVMRKLAKEWKGENVWDFSDEYYEVTFLKCAIAGMLPFEAFLQRVDGLVGLLDNWATCDCFAAPCIKKHREEFLPYVKRYLHDGREFAERYALVTLLHYYTEKRYLPLIFESVQHCSEEKYYVMMAAAWLLAEVLVKYFDAGVAFLKEEKVSLAVRKRAIQKARESFRLTAEQKNLLQSLKKQRFAEKG